MRPEAIKKGYWRVGRLPFISRAAKHNRHDPGSSRSPADVSEVLRQQLGLPSEPFITLSPELFLYFDITGVKKCIAFNINHGKYQAFSVIAGQSAIPIHMGFHIKSVRPVVSRKKELTSIDDRSIKFHIRIQPCLAGWRRFYGMVQKMKYAPSV